jgi:exosortase A
MSTQYRMTGAGPQTVDHVSAWTLHLSVLGGLLLALVVLYWRAVSAAVTVWWVSPTFSHCFLIIPVSAYLIWGKRHELAAMTPSVHPPALLLALPLVATSFVGALASINEIVQLSLIGFVQVLELAVLGPRVYRKILFPSLFLFFLVPMGEYLIAPLQAFTTWFIDVWLGMLGILHYTEGNVIELANGTYQVAEACAGLRFLIATIAVGTLFAYFTYRKWHKIVVFMIACVIVPIIGNGFRALGIVLLAHFSDNRIAVGADHLVYGWGFSVLILALLMFIGMRFADDLTADDGAKSTPVHSHTTRVFAFTVLAALVAMALVPAFQAWRAEASTVDVAAFSRPKQIQGWSTEPVSTDWAPVYSNADASLTFAMRDPGALTPPVDVYVEYYGSELQGHNLISSTNKMWDEDRWHPVRKDQITAKLGGEDVRFAELQISDGGVSRLVWWTYASAGRYTISGMQVKLDRVRTALTGGSGAALVAVSTVMESDLEAARARLRRASANLGGLRDRIAGAKQLTQR